MSPAKKGDRKPHTITEGRKKYCVWRFQQKKKKTPKRITRNRTGGEMKTAQKVPCSLKIEKVGVMC